jgi:hypothetical protein
MGREINEPTHLLDNAEQNLGNSVIVAPQARNPPTQLATTIRQTNPPRILQLSGPSTKGQTTSIVVTASRLNTNQNPYPGYPGPITGIVAFGNGGQFTTVEFDVPIGSFIGDLTNPVPASEPRDGGSIITVPTGVLRVYTRYDNLLIEPLLSTNGLVMLADVQGVDRQGPGGPVSLPIGPPPVVLPAEPVLTRAMAAYFSRHFSRAYKTLYCYVGSPAALGPTPAIVSSRLAPALSPALYCLPAFAQSIKILRQPATASLIVSLYDGCSNPGSTGGGIEQYTVAAGAASPTIPIVGQERIVGVQSATADAVNRVTYLAIACEVGV